MREEFQPGLKLNPKDTLSLFYLAQIALAKNDLDGAIANLNRATVNDARMTGAWALLTTAYLRRAGRRALIRRKPMLTTSAQCVPAKV
jgi:predicted Zn-dependent protease